MYRKIKKSSRFQCCSIQFLSLHNTNSHVLLFFFSWKIIIFSLLFAHYILAMHTRSHVTKTDDHIILSMSKTVAFLLIRFVCKLLRMCIIWMVRYLKVVKVSNNNNCTRNRHSIIIEANIQWMCCTGIE